MEQGKNPLAVRRWSRPWDANVARTSGVRRSFDFWAITNRLLIDCDNHGDGKGGLVKRCKWDIKTPVQDCCCIRWNNRRSMRLYLSSLEGMIPIMVHRQGLSHPYHPRRVKRWYNIGMLNSPCQCHCRSPIAILSVISRGPSPPSTEEATPCLYNDSNTGSGTSCRRGGSDPQPPEPCRLEPVLKELVVYGCAVAQH